MRENKQWQIAAVVVVALVAAAAIWSAAAPLQAEDRPQAFAYAEGNASASDLESPFKAVYEAVRPAVVGIEVTASARVMNGRIVTTTDFAGSGVVISEDGVVLTNYHVIDGAQGLYVVSGGNELPATLIAGDEDSDIAVLRVEAEGLTPAVLGDSDALSVGDWALVVGNPLGEQFVNTLSVGVISGLDRDVRSQTTGRTGLSTSANLIQTDAAINAGNSGGGMFNIAGELVGITSMKLSNNGYYGYAAIEGVGFAIPINGIKQIVSDLIAYGEVRYPRIGVTLTEIASPSMEATEDMLPRSLWVTAVEEGSPAQKAGIRVDDLIVEADGVRVTTAAELQTAVRSHQEGETIQIGIYRIPGLTQIKASEKIPQGESLTLEVEVAVLD
ncbi:MAG TPA: trypsin-like peptidase domain-containing protein [Candidatus Aphodomonas merdavium]|nr:trypsin-like peptidase domain-containing protein [Candidatus Aphodomonas merdavium]